MGRRTRNQSVFDEPHHRRDEFAPDPNEARVDAAMAGARGESESQRVEHGVWDEPAIMALGSAPPGHGGDYAV